jgi:adenylate cyclase
MTFREVDRVRVKGKDEAVTIYQPLGAEAELGREAQQELRLWSQTLRHYRAADWDQADVDLLNLRRANPGCDLYRRYAEKVAERRRNPPPPGWDGVTAFAEK